MKTIKLQNIKTGTLQPHCSNFYFHQWWDWSTVKTTYPMLPRDEFIEDLGVHVITTWRGWGTADSSAGWCAILYSVEVSAVNRSSWNYPLVWGNEAIPENDLASVHSHLWLRVRYLAFWLSSHMKPQCRQEIQEGVMCVQVLPAWAECPCLRKWPRRADMGF